LILNIKKDFVLGLLIITLAVFLLAGCSQGDEFLNDENSISEFIESTEIEIREELETKISKIETVEIETKMKEKADESSVLEDKNTASTGEVVKKEPLVFFSIMGPKEIGAILDRKEVILEEKDTVLDILIRITKEEKIQIEYKGAKSFAYIVGIQNIFEFDYGPKSGWIYVVNGVIPGKSAGAFTLEEGDIIEWFYTIDSGRDIKGLLQ
jgi:hypothetical protein